MSSAARSLVERERDREWDWEWDQQVNVSGVHTVFLSIIHYLLCESGIFCEASSRSAMRKVPKWEHCLSPAACLAAWMPNGRVWGGCMFRAVNGLCTRRIGSTKSHLILDWLRRGSDVKGWEHAWHRDRWKTLYGMRMCALSNMYLYICVWNHEIRSHIESDWAQIPLNRLKETHTHTH